MRALGDFLRAEKAAGKRIYPPGPQMFAALEATPFEEVKVVVLGRTLPRPGQAHGLSFSVPPGVDRAALAAFKIGDFIRREHDESALRWTRRITRCHRALSAWLCTRPLAFTKYHRQKLPIAHKLRFLIPSPARYDHAGARHVMRPTQCVKMVLRDVAVGSALCRTDAIVA
jgi:hypothetical protein